MKKRLILAGSLRLLLIGGCTLALCLAGCGTSDENRLDREEQNRLNGSEDETGNGKEGEDNNNTDAPKENDMEQYKNHVKVMSYNVYYQDVVETRTSNIWDLVLKNDPDVLMLQEVSQDWIPYVQDFMAANGYSYYGYGRYGGELSEAELKNGEQFVPVLWKTEKYELVDSGHYWLSSTPEVYSAAWMDGTISKYPRCVNWVILKDKETGGEFMALNIHTDPENDLVRTNSCKLTAQKVTEIRAGRPAVLGGDWNMSITDSAYYAVTEGGYLDVRFKAIETTTSGSFNAWGKREEGNYAFGDHLFMSEDMGAKSYEVVDDRYDGAHISDHCPIQAELYY